MTSERSRPAEALRQQLDDWLQPILSQLEQAERQQQWLQVEQLCKQALQRDGENWELWQRLARSHEQRSDWAQAETLWRHLTQRFSSRPEPYLALAALQRRRGAPDAARVVLEEAERRVGSSDPFSQALGVIDDPWALGEAIPQLSANARHTEVARALQVAQEHLDSGRFSEAEAVLDQILQARPQAGRVHQQLAQLRWRRGDAEAVITQLQPLLADADRSAGLAERGPLQLLLAQALLRCERWRDAAAVLAALAADPSAAAKAGASLPLLQAEAAIALGDDQAALQWLQAALQQQPNLARAEALRGAVLMRLADWDGAIEVLTRAAALDPQDRATIEQLETAREQRLWWRGEAALERGAWEQAGEAYRQLLERPGGHPQALARLDLLASLQPEALVAGSAAEPLAASTPEGRLAQFQRSLDRMEAQLKMLGVLD